MALEKIKFNIASFNDADANGNNYYAGEVFEIFNTNDTLANIFSDAAGSNPITQNGIDNKSSSAGECVFYIENGDYYIKVSGKVESFTAGFAIPDNVSKIRTQGSERVSEAVGGIVSIQYDGGYVSALGQAWDLHKSRGIPADFAIDGDTINDSAVLRANLETIQRVQEEGGRFSSHGLNVQALGIGTSKETIEYELKESRRVLSELGLDIDGFVAPQGQFDQAYVDIARNNYTWLAGQAFVWDGDPSNAVYKDTDTLFNIHRINMGSTSLANLKSIIDYCVDNNEWVVFYDHAPGSSGPVPPASISLADLEGLLDYIQASSIKALTTSDAISAQFQDASFGYKIKGIADKVAQLNGRVNDAKNLLLDTQFATRLNPNSPWVITNTVGGTTTTANSNSTTEDRVSFNFNGDGAGSGELLLTQDVDLWRMFSFGSGITFTIEMLGNNITSGATISLGLRVIDTSDSSALDSTETELEYKNNRARRMSVTLKNHSELNLATSLVRCFIRINVADAGNQFTATIINPRLTETSVASEYRKNTNSGLVGRDNRLNDFNLISGSWEQLDFTAANIGELYRVSAGRYASLVDATYMISINAATTAADPFGTRIIAQSGSTLNEGRSVNGASSTVMVKLAAGEYFDVQARQLTGADVNLSIAYISAVRLS